MQNTTPRLPRDMSRPPLSRTRSMLWFSAVSVLGTGCDLSTKQWAASELATAPKTVWEPWLGFSLAYNRGTAFSVIPTLGEHMWIFALVAVVVSLGLLGFVFRRRPSGMESVALGSIVAGALGNGFDRAFRAAPGGGTGVVDFIAVVLPGGGRWPTFNIADVLLAVGVGLLVIAWAQGRGHGTRRTTSAAA